MDLIIHKSEGFGQFKNTLHSLLFRSAVDYLASKLNIGLTTEEIWRIFAGSVTNDFSHSHSQGREVIKNF